jgi:hypothetical protein
MGFGQLDTTLTRNDTETIGRLIPNGTPGATPGSPRTLEARNDIIDSRFAGTVGALAFTVGGQYWKARMVEGVAPEPFTFTQWAGFALNLDGVGDFTRATIVTPIANQAAPRIPALRLLGGIEAKSDRLDLRAETEWVDGQSRVAPFETTTKGYTMVNASVAVRPWGRDRDVSLLLSANNIFDVNARRHASFLKDYAPLAGRDVRVSLRFGF